MYRLRRDRDAPQVASLCYHIIGAGGTTNGTMGCATPI
jgi:hypothetical protein